MSNLAGRQYALSPTGTWTAVPAELNGAPIGPEGPGTIFYDDFSTVGTFDTTDLWTLVSGTAPTVAGGIATMSTTASTFNVIRSQDLMPTGTGYAVYRAGIIIETSAAVGAGRFFGLLSGPSSSPTATSLVAEGVGFEIDQATGALYAVTYTGNTRTIQATLVAGSAATGTGATTNTVPAIRDGAIHAYEVKHRVTRTDWSIDGVLMASIRFASVASQDLYVGHIRQNAASYTGVPLFSLTAVFVGDTARDSTMISDGKNGARRVKVRADGSMNVNLASSAGSIANVTGTLSTASASPTTQIPSTVSTSGVVADVSLAGNATIAVSTSGTTNATLVFEATVDSAGTAATWFPIDFTRTDGSAVETRSIVTGTSITAWNVMLPGYKYVRVRLAAVTTAGTIGVVMTQGPFLYDPSPATTMNPLVPLAGPSANPGSVPAPAYLSIATTTATALIAAPATGLSIYVTDMEGSNSAATATRTDFTEGVAGTVRYSRYMAATGGGFATNLRTPWKLAAATALGLTQSAANQGYYTVNYYIAP